MDNICLFITSTAPHAVRIGDSSLRQRVGVQRQSLTSPITIPSLSRYRRVRHTIQTPFASASASSGQQQQQTQQNESTPSSSSSSSSPKKPVTRRVTSLSIMLFIVGFLTSIPTLFMICISYLLGRDKGQRLRNQCLKQWFRAILSICGIKVRLKQQSTTTNGSNYSTTNLPIQQQQQQQQRTVLVSNRQCSLDVLAICSSDISSISPRFVVPSSALRLPLLGWILQACGCAGIPNDDRRAATTALANAISEKNSPAILLLFPEGRAGLDNKVGKFLSPPFKTAREENMAVVPISVSGGRDLCNDDAGVMPARRGTITISVHPRVDEDGISDKELTTRAYDAVSRGVENVQRRDE